MSGILTCPGEHCNIMFLRADSYWNAHGAEKKGTGKQLSTQQKQVGRDQKQPTFKPGCGGVVGSQEPGFQVRVVTMVYAGTLNIWTKKTNSGKRSLKHSGMFIQDC